MMIRTEVESLDKSRYKQVKEIFCGLRQLWKDGVQDKMIASVNEMNFDILSLIHTIQLILIIWNCWNSFFTKNLIKNHFGSLNNNNGLVFYITCCNFWR